MINSVEVTQVTVPTLNTKNAPNIAIKPFTITLSNSQEYYCMLEALAIATHVKGGVWQYKNWCKKLRLSMYDAGLKRGDMRLLQD